MASFIIDENLPYYFSLWHNKNHIHVFGIPNNSTDEEIWNYAKRHNMVIVSKDADFFSNKILFNTPPPKVIHLKIGNMKITELHNFLNKVWPEILIQIKN